MLQNKINEAEKSEHAKPSSGGWYKFQEGENLLRILTEPETIYEDYKNGICYTDCDFKGSPKGMAYVQDMKDGDKIKLFKMPWKMFKQVASWETDSEYGFTGYPMPYHIKVGAAGAGTKEVEYTFTAGRTNTDVPSAVLEELSKTKPVAEIIESLKEKNKEKHATLQKAEEKALPTVEYPTAEEEGIAPEDIPF